MSNVSLMQPAIPVLSAQVPAHARPSLWAAFDKVWFALKGYHAEDFKFVAGKTPVSTLGETTAIILAYLVVIFGGRELMRNRKPFELNTLFKVHNLFLTILSGALLALFVEQLVPSLWRDGFYENICGAPGWTDPLVTLYYVRFEHHEPVFGLANIFSAAQLPHEIYRAR